MLKFLLFFIYNKVYKFDLLDFFNSPYIIGTMNQATSSTPNLQLHHNFRYCLFMFLIYVCGLTKEQWLLSHLKLFLSAEMANWDRNTILQ